MIICVLKALQVENLPESLLAGAKLNKKTAKLQAVPCTTTHLQPDSHAHLPLHTKRQYKVLPAVCPGEDIYEPIVQGLLAHAGCAVYMHVVAHGILSCWLAAGMAGPGHSDMLC